VTVGESATGWSRSERHHPRAAVTNLAVSAAGVTPSASAPATFAPGGNARSRSPSAERAGACRSRGESRPGPPPAVVSLGGQGVVGGCRDLTAAPTQVAFGDVTVAASARRA
jgi:hypothetical protein